jgi:hypothetical protein
MARREPTDAEILAQIPAARARAREADAAEPRARSARYDTATKRVVVELTNGCALHFPPALAQGLGDASASELQTVEVYPGGIGLRWDALDVDLSVPRLVEGIFGGIAWTASQLGKRGGRASSAAKAAAVRENGKKGGRPRKTSAPSA